MSRPAADRKFDQTLELQAPREVVWEALASPEGLTRWFAPEAALEPGVGGSVRWSWPGLHDWPQRIVVWEPKARLVTHYDSAVDDGAGGKRPLVIDFRLRGDGGATTLRLVHSGFGPDSAFDEEYDGISRGWPIELQSLRHYAERHAGRERALAWSHRAVRLDAETAWRVLTGPAGLDLDVRQLRDGAPFALALPGGEPIDGDVVVARGTEFCGVAATHGDGFVRVAVEPCGGPITVWLSLERWDGDEEAARSTQRHFEALIDRLFPVEVRA